jgi:hypothetical protein
MWDSLFWPVNNINSEARILPSSVVRKSTEEAVSLMYHPTPLNVERKCYLPFFFAEEHHSSTTGGVGGAAQGVASHVPGTVESF